jgi:hypothetical protein
MRCANRKPGFLQKFIAWLVIEHTCSPPDCETAWQIVPQSMADGLARDLYVCPECGQHMVRRERIHAAA